MCCHDHHRDFGHHEWHHHHHWGRHDHGPRHHRDPHHHHCGPDCFGRDFGPRGRDLGPFGFQRRFVSNREVLEVLKKYLQELENEASGVREAIAEIEEDLKEEADRGE